MDEKMSTQEFAKSFRRISHFIIIRDPISIPIRRAYILNFPLTPFKMNVKSLGYQGKVQQFKRQSNVNT
jgi:hypothetical protein